MNLLKIAPTAAVMALASCSGTDAYQLQPEPQTTLETREIRAPLRFYDSGSSISYGLNAFFDTVVDPNGDGDCDDAVFNDQTIVATEETTVSDEIQTLAFISDEDYCVRVRAGWRLFLDPDNDLLTNNWQEITSQVELTSDNPMPVSITTGTTSEVTVEFSWPGGIPLRWGLAELGLSVVGGDDCSGDCPSLADAPPDADSVCLDSGNGAECHDLCATVNGNDDCPMSCDNGANPDTQAYCLRGGVPAPYPGVCVCRAS